MGDDLTEADIRLFTSLIRFDPVYHGHYHGDFKCNLKRIVDYPNLWGYTRDIFQLPGVGEPIDFDHIKRHYYGSRKNVNPSGVVPAGPVLDWLAPHHREYQSDRKSSARG